MKALEDRLRGIRQQLLEVNALAGVLASGDLLDAERLQALAGIAHTQSQAALDHLDGLIDTVEDQILACAS